MNGPMLFGVIVRTVGLVLILQGLWPFVQAAAMMIGLSADEAIRLVLEVGIPVVIGVFLLMQADTIVKWTYRDRN